MAAHRRLVRTAELFGISEGTARTALSRMASAGEADGAGGGYQLAGRLAARQDRQTASRRATTLPWDGSWELAVVDADGRRSAADRAACATPSPRCAWSSSARACGRDPTTSTQGRLPAPGPSPTVVPALARRHARPRAGPRRAVRPAGVAGRRRRAARRDGRAPARLERGRHRGARLGFVTSAAVLRHLQHDPLLPRPSSSPRLAGDELRSEYDRYDAAYRAVLVPWLQA